MEVDISTKYAGLKLKSPIIVGACSLTSNISNIVEIAKQGAGAIVLKSIYEEEIFNEYQKILKNSKNKGIDDENLDYLDLKIRHQNLDTYLELIKNAKKLVDIPIFASINCISPHEWSFYAQKMAEAGANGLELNIFALPVEMTKNSQEIEKIYKSIVTEIKNYIKIPVVLKLPHYFTSLANSLIEFSKLGVSGLVLFNRFYNLDIDIHSRKVVVGEIFSRPSDYVLPLRWIALTSGKVDCSLGASTGVHNWEIAIKMLLAGANAVQIVSAVYLNGFGIIKEINEKIVKYLNDNNFEALTQIIGLSNQKNIDNPAMYERFQFLRYYADYSDII